MVGEKQISRVIKFNRATEEMRTEVDIVWSGEDAFYIIGLVRRAKRMDGLVVVIKWSRALRGV